MNFVDQKIQEYCLAHSSLPSDIPREIAAHTRTSVHGAQMLIGEMEAALLGLLIKFGNVRRVLELGTFTGYSALAMAELLPDGGSLITVDINPETSQLARTFWQKSAHGAKIRQILKPGLEALAELDGNFDLIFIDADKNNYLNYLKWSLAHLSPRGLIVVDNTLWSGKVLQPAEDRQTQSIQEHNEFARSIDGFTKVLLPIRDGMFLITRN